MTTPPRLAVTAAELDGRVFCAATDTDGHEIVAGSEVTITFSGDTLAVATGCNGLTGGYTIESGRLVTGEMAATLMACEEPLTTQEAWIAEFVGSNPAIELDGNELELESRRQAMSLDEVS